jgi:hypothetical protein
MSWAGPVNGAEAGDRPDFPAAAVSPDGDDVLSGVRRVPRSVPHEHERYAPIPRVVRYAAGDLGAWMTLNRGAVGDARGSRANALSTEFLGIATNDYGAATWNDPRDAADCPAVDAWRASLATSSPLPKPAANTDCLATFGTPTSPIGSVRRRRRAPRCYFGPASARAYPRRPRWAVEPVQGRHPTGQERRFWLWHVVHPVWSTYGVLMNMPVRGCRFQRTG